MTGGAWASCPDPVDFRAFELFDLYTATNAYVNEFGFERPSERTVQGDVRLTMRREVGVENLLGPGDNWTRSGLQWCQWNAVFGPRGADGLPAVAWDPRTGAINAAVAAQWKPYDLRLVLEQNWKTLAPKIQGKLHIAAGEADNYYLNNAVHLFEAAVAQLDPPFKGSIVYGPGQGHGWSNLSLDAMLREMASATR